MPSITRPDTPLRLVLQEQGRMQKWLAEAVGVDASQISDYVRGLHVPAEPTRAAIAQALDVPEHDLWPATQSEAA